MSGVQDMTLWRNKKTGNLYRVVFANVINSTNREDGQQMVYYRRDELEADQQAYVRDRDEFLVKFEPIEEIEEVRVEDVEE